MSNTKTREMTLEEKLAAIEAAVSASDGNTEKENYILNSIIDPQDENQCEGCQ